MEKTFAYTKLLEQFVQITAQRWIRVLNITRPIYIITDLKTWQQFFPTTKKDLAATGLMQYDFGVLYVNLDYARHGIFSELEDTILHELLHFKYPRKSEGEIKKWVKKLLKN